MSPVLVFKLGPGRQTPNDRERVGRYTARGGQHRAVGVAHLSRISGAGERQGRDGCQQVSIGLRRSRLSIAAVDNDLSFVVDGDRAEQCDVRRKAENQGIQIEYLAAHPEVASPVPDEPFSE